MIFEFVLASVGAGYATVLLVVALLLLVSLQMLYAALPERLLDVDDAGEGWVAGARTNELPDRSWRLRRWYIVGAICALVPPALWGTRYLFVEFGAPGCDGDLLYACFLDVAQLELAYLLVIVGIPVALLYLDRAHLAGVRDAVVFAFCIWAVPRSVFAQAVDLHLLFALATSVGIVALVASFFVQAGIRRIALRFTSLIALLLPMLPALTLNSPVVLIGFPVTAILIGYGIYRIEWKTMSYGVRLNRDYANNHNDVVEADHGALRRAKLTGRSLFVAGVVAAVAMSWLLNFVWDRMGGSANQGIAALFAMLLAALAAGTMYKVSRKFAVEQLALDRALVTFVVVVTSASVFHAVGLPPVTDVSGSSEGWFAGTWLSFVAAVASIGALLLVVTTLTRWMLQLRPFLVGMTWLVWAALPANEVNMYDPVEFTWPQLILGAVLAVAALWLMWYGFGPGRASVGLKASQR